MKNAIVIGRGMVGNATMVELGIKDYYSRSSQSVKYGDLCRFKYIFLCLPTPTVNGKCDTHLIEDYIRLICAYHQDNIFIIRSTVLPGTTASLARRYGVSIVHVPEFLTEATWKEDTKEPNQVIVGGNDGVSRKAVAALFRKAHPETLVLLTSSQTSETIKYALNTFYATKVVFANQIYDFCQKIGVDYDEVKGALYCSKWVGLNHLDVWHNNKRGAGGKCLEKDLDALASHTGLPLLQVANALNKQYLHDTETYPSVR